MNNNLDLKVRTKQFALSIIRLFVSLQKTVEAQIIGKQLLRAGTSVGAHFREASRAHSSAEFISKVEVGLQELEETVYWIELLTDSSILDPRSVKWLLKEADELTAILVTCVKNAKKGRPE